MTHPKMDAADLEVDDRSQFDITYPYDNVSNPHGNNQTQKPAQVAQPVPRGVKPRSGRAPPYHRLEGVDPFLPNPSLEDQTLPFVPNSSLPMDDLSFNIPGDLMNSIHAGRNPQVYGSAQMMSQELNMANFNPSRLNKMSARPDEPETQRPPPSKRQHVQANESPAGGGVGVWEGSLNQYGTSSSLPYPPNVSHYPSSILNPQQGFPGPSSIDEGLRNPSIPLQLYSGQGIPHNEGQQPIWALNQSISQGGSYGSRSVGGGGGGIVGGSLQGQVVQDSEGNLYRIIQDVVPMPNHHEQPLGLDNVSSLGQGGFGSDLTHGLPSQVPQSYTQQQQQQQQQPSSSFGFRPTTSQSTRGFSSQQ